MDAIEVKVNNVNLIEVEFEPGQTNIEISANFNPVIEVKEFDYPEELVHVNQRISQILQANGRLVEWNKSVTHIQYRYAGDNDWIDLVALSELKGEQGIQGLKGDKGDQGEQGIQGLKGDKGDQGEQGIQGLKGDKGNQGEQGIQGLKGDKGDPQTRDGLGLGLTDSPEFANTLNTALNTTAEQGGEITPTLWAWIQSVYSAIVAKSVKSHIIGLWAIVEILWKERSELYSVTLTQSASSITINADNLGNPFSLKNMELLLIIPSLGVNAVRFRINGIQTLNYNGYNSVNSSYFNIIIGENGGFVKVQFDFDLSSQTLLMSALSGRKYASGVSFATYASAGFMNFGSITEAISSILVYPASGDFPIGTKIVIRNGKKSSNG